MPLGTLDRSPPPFFRQGPSALSKLMFFSALALFLMVADTRFKVAKPIRATVATVLYPVQWLAMQPVHLAEYAGTYFTSLTTAQRAEEAARHRLLQMSARAGQVEQLTIENTRLRQLLALRGQLAVQSQAAEVLYDAPDPYTRRVIIGRGLTHGVVAGSPVLDEFGVLGQVTRVYPLVSEVTLVIDRSLAIPVLNTRTGARSVAYGDPVTLGGALELRFMPANADVKEGDLLSTSGVDGVYPPGVPVARVAQVERRSDTPFARIHCAPLALVQGTRHVMVLKPQTDQLEPAPSPAPSPVPVARKRGASS